MMYKHRTRSVQTPYAYRTSERTNPADLYSFYSVFIPVLNPIYCRFIAALLPLYCCFIANLLPIYTQFIPCLNSNNTEESEKTPTSILQAYRPSRTKKRTSVPESNLRIRTSRFRKIFSPNFLRKYIFSAK